MAADTLRLVFRTSAAPIALLAILAVESGCSWTLMTAPPEEPELVGLPPACTTSRAAPVADLLLSLPAGLVVGISAFAVAGGTFAVDPEEERGGAKAAGTIAALTTTGLLLASSISGFRKASRCRAARAEYDGEY